MFLNRLDYRAPRFVGMGTVRELTILRELEDFLKIAGQLFLFDMQGELINKGGYQEMLGIAYWSSTLTGSARAKKINYYDAVEAAMATVSLSSQSTVEGSVRAIAQFEIK